MFRAYCGSETSSGLPTASANWPKALRMARAGGRQRGWGTSERQLDTRTRPSDWGRQCTTTGHKDETKTETKTETEKQKQKQKQEQN